MLQHSLTHLAHSWGFFSLFRSAGRKINDATHSRLKCARHGNLYDVVTSRFIKYNARGWVRVKVWALNPQNSRLVVEHDTFILAWNRKRDHETKNSAFILQVAFNIYRTSKWSNKIAIIDSLTISSVIRCSSELVESFDSSLQYTRPISNNKCNSEDKIGNCIDGVAQRQPFRWYRTWMPVQWHCVRHKQHECRMNRTKFGAQFIETVQGLRIHRANASICGRITS